MSESVVAASRSKTTTAASFSVVMLVSYLALVHLKAILMPLAIAILLYFLIRAPEKFLFEKVGNSVISYALILAFSILLAYGISIVLYSNLSSFIDEVPMMAEKLDSKMARLSEADLYGLEKGFSSSEIIASVITVENIEVFVTSILGSLASFMTTMGAVLLFLVFIILEEKTLPDRFRAAFPGSIGRIENIVSRSEPITL